MSQELTLSIPRLQEAWRLYAHVHQVDNVFHLGGGGSFTSVKQLRVVHEMCYLGEELKQRMWGRVCAGKAP